jgi:hypothetical protein
MFNHIDMLPDAGCSVKFFFRRPGKKLWLYKKEMPVAGILKYGRFLYGCAYVFFYLAAFLTDAAKSEPVSAAAAKQ